MKFLALCVSLLLLAPTVLANPNTIAYKAPQAPRTIDEIISDKSLEYGVSEAQMRAVIGCESQFRNIQSQLPGTAPNGQEDSWGYVQIHLPSWPDITKEQALDPEFAITFLAEKLSKGQGHYWTCYRQLYTQSTSYPQVVV